MPDNIAMNDPDEALFAQQQVARLQALLEASRLIHSTIVLDEVLNTVLRIVVRELELDGAFFKHFLNSYGDVPQTFTVPERDALDPLVERTGDTTLWDPVSVTRQGGRNLHGAGCYLPGRSSPDAG